MNRKIIKGILNKKLNDWTSTIEDPIVQELARKNTIVTGGAIASLLLGEEVKDFDLYFKNKETTLAIANYYVNNFNDSKKSKIAEVKCVTDLMGEDRVKIVISSRGVAVEDGKESVLESPFEDAVQTLSDADHVDAKLSDTEGDIQKSYRPVFLSSNAITLSDKIQLVVRFFGDADQVHKSYDFVHCTNWFDYGSKELILKAEALECLINKELKYQGSRYPVCSVIRTRKFIQRGFHINAGSYLKMCFQISNLDLNNIEVLEDQLIGVDSAYFSMLIDALKSKQESDPNFRVDSGYLSSLIDKIF